MNDQIISALSWRFATKVFDPSKRVSDEDLQTILEAGRLSPSSFGVEPWKFIVVENLEIRKELRAVGYDQPKITDASHLIIIARRTDAREHITNELMERTAKTRGVPMSELEEFRKMVQGSVDAKNDEKLDAWICAQVYIPLGIMVEAASLLQIDNGPMEGFDPAGVDRILGLAEKHLTATTMLALGYRGEDPLATKPKVRRSFDEVIEFVK